jgi:sirohydrochlorin cobaltochelatase
VFGDDALLLIGHGSSRYTEAGRMLSEQARRISATGSCREVGMGLLNGAPSVADALERMTAPRIRVVPFFMEDGYFTRVAVPRALGIPDNSGPGVGVAAGGAAGARLLLCPAVGTHDGMVELIARLVLDGCAERGIEANTTSVVIVGHGSARSPGQALALHRHTTRLSTMRRFAAVTAACLEEAPFVATVLRGLRTHPVAVVGFFAAEGGHVRDDLPTLIATERVMRDAAGREIHNLGPVTDTPLMTRIILDQARAV